MTSSAGAGDENHAISMPPRDDSFGVPMTLKDYRQMLTASSQGELRARLHEQGVSVQRSRGPALGAYVNAGRVVADCPVCGSGVACGLDDPEAVCMECGTTHRIQVPDRTEINEALAVLEARPMRARNWVPGAETVDDLRRENDAHGFPRHRDDLRPEHFGPAPEPRLTPFNERLMRPELELTPEEREAVMRATSTPRNKSDEKAW